MKKHFVTVSVMLRFYFVIYFSSFFLLYLSMTQKKGEKQCLYKYLFLFDYEYKTYKKNKKQ